MKLKVKETKIKSWERRDCNTDGRKHFSNAKITRRNRKINTTQKEQEREEKSEQEEIDEEIIRDEKENQTR